MNFKIFINRNTITISKYYQIIFTKKISRIYELTEYKLALFLFNEKTKQIGIKFTNEIEDGCHKICVSKRKAIILSASSFLKKYDINCIPTKYCTFEYDEKTKMFIIDTYKNKLLNSQ